MKITGPLLSISCSKSFHDLSYRKDKGKTVVYIKPPGNDQKTSSQITCRTRMRSSLDAWTSTLLSGTVKTAWAKFCHFLAKSQSGYNAMIQSSLNAYKYEADPIICYDVIATPAGNHVIFFANLSDGQVTDSTDTVTLSYSSDGRSWSYACTKTISYGTISTPIWSDDFPTARYYRVLLNNVEKSGVIEISTVPVWDPRSYYDHGVYSTASDMAHLADGAAVTAWPNNLSPYSDWSDGGSGNGPLFYSTGLNGKPSLYFEGNKWLRLPLVANTEGRSARTILFLGQITEDIVSASAVAWSNYVVSPESGYAIFVRLSGTLRRAYQAKSGGSNAVSLGEYTKCIEVWSHVFSSGTTFDLALNNGIPTNDTPGTYTVSGNSYNFIGWLGTTQSPWRGWITSIIMYPYALSYKQRAVAQLYLMAEGGLI